jgi:hypothetical protein
MAELPVGTDSFPGMPPLRMARTAPGALAMAGSPGAGAGASPAPLGLPFAVSMAVQPSVQAGREFPVSIRLPVGADVREGQVVLEFDPALLESPGGGPSPGSVSVPVVAGSSALMVRLRAREGREGMASIRVADAEVVDASGFAVGLQLPEPVKVEIRR